MISKDGVTFGEMWLSRTPAPPGTRAFSVEEPGAPDLAKGDEDDAALAPPSERLLLHLDLAALMTWLSI
ncbi:hypothetical protein BGZ82_006510 [Podila clonocystis]|nr:hypothetical protein BGZ82_006510 [Podila clonocystis]